jgi:hypothetical protein
MIRLIPVVLLLSACTGQMNPIEATVRATAKSVVLPVVQERVPGPQAEVVTGCIIDNATRDEAVELARDVGNRAGTSTIQNIAAILRRPATLQCVQRAGIGGLAL